MLQPKLNSRRHNASGFSLVELMVAITIGLALLAGLALMFGNSSLSGSELEKSVRQMENGRFSTDLLSEEISLAGYYGELPIDTLTAAPVGGCVTTANALGWNNATTTVPVRVTGLSAAEATALTCLANRKPNTPALILRRLETLTVAPAAITANTLYVQSTRCNSDPVATVFVASTSSAAFTLRDLNCTTLTNVRRYVHRVYFIASCDECGVDTVPTLKRAELVADQMVVTPLAQGIDDFGFEFGFDTNGDGAPDLYRTALSGTALAADNDWNNVVAVRTHLLARTTEPTAGFTENKTYSLGLAGTRGPFTDGFKRRVFSATGRLNNPAGFKDVPATGT